MWNPKMQAMKGITVLGMLLTAILIVFIVAIGINLGPPYLQYYAVKNSMEAMAKDPEMVHASKGKLRELFIRRLTVNDIRNISPDALVLERDHDKESLSIQYEVRVHLIANIDAVLKFDNRVMIE